MLRVRITVGEDSALGEVEIFGRHFQEHRRGAEDLTPKLLGGRLHRRPTADDAPACRGPEGANGPALCIAEPHPDVRRVDAESCSGDRCEGSLDPLSDLNQAGLEDHAPVGLHPETHSFEGWSCPAGFRRLSG